MASYSSSMSMTLSNRIRVLRAIRDRTNKLDRQLQQGRHRQALRTFTQCSHLNRTREQTSHLAKQAFNAALVLEELGDLGSDDLVLKWLGNCLEMSREAQDSELADKCLVTMVRHLHRNDPDRARACLDAVKSEDDYQVSVARLALSKSADSEGTIQHLLDKVLKTFPGGVGEAKRLMRLVEGRDARFSVQILECAFEKCADDAMEKEELYSISLELAASHRLVSECQSLVQDYASWCCTHLKGQRMRTKELYERAMSASHRHVLHRGSLFK